MGQSRYGPLPRTRNWRRVVQLLDQGSSIPTESIARATLRAARSRIAAQRNSPGLAHCVWLLLQLPKSARRKELDNFSKRLGISAEATESPATLLAALSRYLQRYALQQPHNSALSEIAPLAFKEAFSRMLAQPNLHLFARGAEELRSVLRRYSDGPGFSESATTFLGAFLRRSLLYFLSKEIGNHLGPGAGFDDATRVASFEEAIRQYCQDRAKIIGEFAADWYGKHVWKGEDSEQHVRRFVAVCLRKFLEELQLEEPSQ